MQISCKLTGEEFNEHFWKSIHLLFQNKSIQIDIQELESDNEYRNDTEYLMRTPEMEADHLQRIEDINNRKNLISFTMEELNEYVKTGFIPTKSV